MNDTDTKNMIIELEWPPLATAPSGRVYPDQSRNMSGFLPGHAVGTSWIATQGLLHVEVEVSFPDGVASAQIGHSVVRNDNYDYVCEYLGKFRFA